MDTMTREDIQWKEPQYHYREFDVPMPPLRAEDMDDDGVVRLYEAVFDRAKVDYVNARKDILWGFPRHDMKIRAKKLAKAEAMIEEVKLSLQHWGIKDDRLQKLVDMMEKEASDWWENYKRTAQARAAKQWAKWGTVDDDIY
jgi:hypothetical protein